MPLEKQLNVTLANNSIEVLEARDYLERVVNLDITYNGLKEVEAEALRFLRNVQKLDLRGNQIAYLPDTLQILPSSAVTIDPYTLSCDCNMLWFSSWKLLYVETRDKGDNFVRSDGQQPPEADADIFCLLRDGKYIPMTEATKERLGCIKAITPLPLIVAVAIVASIVLCGIALAAIFRYEILVLCHMFMSVANKQHKKQVLPHEKDTGKDKKDRQQQRHDAHGYTHDVYISCSDSDTDLDWVIHRLLPMLDQRGVKSYLLVRDSPPGVVAVDEAVKNIRDSHVVLVVLSAEYAASATCLFQFSQAYNFTLGRSASESVRKDRRRLLVLEVDGGARYGHVGEPHLKAMLRMRMTLCGDNPRDMERVCSDYFRHLMEYKRGL
ncbi:uncharacterized protein LOC112560148 [Pomacea canaliculata]|nr:uncharacterized protein LOC112560148 [Pomacea canaliculata]